MNKFAIAAIFAAVICARVSHAQLRPGEIVPDFTLKDTKGETHALYSYLNQGKFVVLDVFATWCGPCWDYH